MSKGYYLEWDECQWHSVGVMFFYGNESNGSCPDILNNFILLQLQDLFNTSLTMVVFNVYGGFRMVV